MTRVLPLPQQQQLPGLAADQALAAAPAAAAAGPPPAAAVGAAAGLLLALTSAAVHAELHQALAAAGLEWLTPGGEKGRVGVVRTRI